MRKFYNPEDYKRAPLDALEQRKDWLTKVRKCLIFTWSIAVIVYFVAPILFSMSIERYLGYGALIIFGMAYFNSIIKNELSMIDLSILFKS